MSILIRTDKFYFKQINIFRYIQHESFEIK